MPSSWSPSLRFELQFTGENINLWGEKLNAALTRADYAIAGWLTKPLTGDYVLTTANGADDEARAAMLKFTGAGPFTVTIPSVSKSYVVWNACSGDLTITTGAGATVTIDPGDRISIFSDGAGVYQPSFSGYGLKDFIAASVLSATGSMPAVPGNAGKYLFCDGSTWLPKAPATTDLSDFSNILGVQIALAVAL